MIVGRTLLPPLLWAAILVAPAAPAAAQYGMAPPPPPPQNIPRNDAQPNANAPLTPATPAELQAAAACLVGRNPAAADALFATAPYSAAERQQAVRLLSEMQRCLHQRTPIATSAVLVRSAFAEIVYEARFTAPQANHSPALAVKPLLQPALAANSADAAALAPEYSLAECTAAHHPELIIGLLQTEPLTPGAQTAFQALNPAFAGCVARDARISVDGRTIRGILAESLYRWSVVQRDGPASTWAAQAATAAAAAH
jgi:hypothetical protein